MAGNEITFCECLGPMYGEPYCICTMKRLGLPLNTEARGIEHARAKEQLSALFTPGGLWYRAPLPIIPANIRVLKSRNQREGYYGGWMWVAILIAELPTGEQLWKPIYKAHGRVNRERSLRKAYAKP